MGDALLLPAGKLGGVKCGTLGEATRLSSVRARLRASALLQPMTLRRAMETFSSAVR